MEDLHLQVLKKNRPYLVKQLMLDDLWQYLVAEDVFTDDMIERIKATGASPAQTQRLLTDLTRRGPEAFPKFLQCLIDSDQPHIAEKLMATEEILKKKEPRDLISKLNAKLQVSKASAMSNGSASTPHMTTSSISNDFTASHSTLFASTPLHKPTQGNGTMPTAVIVDPTIHAVSLNGATDRGQTQRLVSLIGSSQTSSPMENRRPTQLSFTAPRTVPRREEETTPDRLAPNRQTVKKSLFTTTTTDNGEGIEIANPYPEHFGIPYTEGRLDMDMAAPSHTAATTDSTAYKMTSRPRGYCIIINNRHFPGTHLKQRLGTDVDRDNLRTLFIQLGYMVSVQENLSGMEMLIVLRDFAALPDHQTVDSCVVVLLTHGLDGQVYGSDGKLVNLSEAFNFFDGNNCATLRGKPKFFLVQACRGESYDTGFDCTDDDGATDAAGGSEAIVEMQRQQDVDINMLSQKLPSGADYLIAYATVPGFVSWRNSEQGSWFVQALCEIFSEQCYYEDAVSMLVEVNNRVATIYESATKHKQMPQPVLLLRKKLFFSPIVDDLDQ